MVRKLIARRSMFYVIQTFTTCSTLIAKLFYIVVDLHIMVTIFDISLLYCICSFTLTFFPSFNKAFSLFFFKKKLRFDCFSVTSFSPSSTFRKSFFWLATGRTSAMEKRDSDVRMSDGGARKPSSFIPVLVVKHMRDIYEFGESVGSGQYGAVYKATYKQETQINMCD